ncbi:MAG: helicase-exonuclease AddAB subunit AddA [Clostridiales bacterium]|nr:helicase-exonuclease AddAB subunit AddA [Clostridiales bacterium]
MANGFTEEQLKAIETLDKSVLVSAAAGSGKTSVLIERIIRIILEGRANVDEMLVVTFTNAAASEMKLRLASAIRKRMADHPEDVARMKDQLARLYKAYISTIDSFALRVIKEFFHMTDMEPSFGVADEVQCELLRREAMSEMFEEGFENDDLIEGGSFRAFLRLYSEERSDDAFMDDMLDAYSRLRTMPDYFDWAYEKAEQLKVTADTFEGSDFQKMMFADAETVLSRVRGAFTELRKMFAYAGIYGMYEKKLAEQEAAVNAIYDTLISGHAGKEVIAAIENIPSTRLVPAKAQKEAYDAIKTDVKKINDALKKEIGDLKKRYMIPDLGTRLSEMNATYEYTVYYLRMLEEFERRYDAKKREKRVIDFADMEHIAVRILKNDDAADTLRRRFRFIFVDEYQDTNNIQENLISRVARPDNVFRVGDVKQSIYKFRQAEPEIFERLYAKYTAGEEPSGIAIDLGRNFRTNNAAITYINHVFKNVMDGYDERSMLYTGIECPPEYDFIPEVHVLIDDSGEDEDDTFDPEDVGADEEIEELSKEEAEAEYIAGLVQSIIGTEFFDSKAGVVRTAGARDIAILFRAVKYRGEIMSRALRERAIEAHVEETEDFFDTIEIEVALALLTCIDNMKRDVQLISVLHSEVFGFSPDELARIRIEHSRAVRERSAYWKAFEWFTEAGPESALKKKASDARAALMEWRRLSRTLPLEDFVWKVLVDSGYYRMAGAMPGGASRQANLRTLADRAGRFSKDSIATLSSFITFLDLLKSKKIKNGQTSMVGRDDDVVRISTIHKSKGLEYPFVIVGGLGHRFRYDTNSKGFSFDPEGGVGLPYVDPARRYWRSTVLQRAINSKSRNDSYREEMRLLYVAMTRARNKLYMVGTCKSEEELNSYQLHPANFLKAMQNVLRSGFNRLYISPLMLTKAADDKGADGRISAYFDRPLNEEEQAIYNEIERRFRYRYPDEDLLTEKAKYSVSAIRKEELEKERLQRKEAVVTSDDEVTHLRTGVEQSKRASAADIGIAYHRVMEFLDFSKAADPPGKVNMEYIEERAAFLREHNAIDEDVFSEIDLDRLSAFFSSDLGKRATEAAGRGTLMREKPFTLRTVRDGREMLVQGVIDCCFEENGKMIIIDYKSNFIRPDRKHQAELERIKEEYKVQIELYSEAIEKGMGMRVGEAYLYLFASGETIDMM